MIAPVARALFGSRLNLLILLLPAAVVLELVESSPVLVFAASGLSIVPLAGLIGRATEQLAHHVGPGLGGLLNATFGNGAELLIAGFALQRGLVGVVKSSLSGSIISNILLVLGLAILVGGWGRERQQFSRTGASAQTLMLFLAVVALAIPAVYDVIVLGSMTQSNLALDELSLLTALVLLVAYVCGLIFSLKTHREIVNRQSAEEGVPGSRPRHASHEKPEMTAGAAMVLLAVATVLTAGAAEVLSGSAEAAAHLLGMTELFVGMIVIAIVGNAAEQAAAVVFARRGNMQLAMNIATSASVQIALLVAPVLVILSWIMGQPMNLVFHPFELFGIAVAVGAVTLVAIDGESHWYEGLLLLAVYLILAITIYFVPG